MVSQGFQVTLWLRGHGELNLGTELAEPRE